MSSDNNRVEALDRSFASMFIIISVVNAGIIIPKALEMEATHPIATSYILFLQVLPILSLILIWWIGLFFSKLPFKLCGWLMLFTLVLNSIIFICIWLGVDRMLGFNVYWLVLAYLVTPIPSSLIVAGPVRRRYYTILERKMGLKEKIITIVLAVFFLIYYWAVPFDPSKILLIVSQLSSQ